MDKNFISNENEWKQEIDRALCKYDANNVNIMLDEESGWLYISYHSDNNSFAISELLSPKSMTKLNIIKKLAKEYGIGYCI